MSVSVSRGVRRFSPAVLVSVLALACGDALGAPAEFKSQAEVKKRWGTLQDMVGGGPWQPGEWTDDTAMALAVAEGILENPEHPVEAIGRRVGYANPFAFSTAFKRRFGMAPRQYRQQGPIPGSLPVPDSSAAPDAISAADHWH